MNLAEAAQPLADAARASPADILAAARTRPDRAEAVYAGAVTPREAWTLVQAGIAQLVDVRTPAELRYVGSVPGALAVEWTGKDTDHVERFLAALARQAEPAGTLLFLCRSGVRSHHAANAAARAGWAHAFNVLEGFEGQRNHAQQRGAVDGWRHHGLPWVQD